MLVSLKPNAKNLPREGFGPETPSLPGKNFWPKERAFVSFRLNFLLINEQWNQQRTSH
jgi:hypothetical protein